MKGFTGNTKRETTIKVEIANRQPATIAYLRHLGPYGESISRFWQQTYVPWAIKSNLETDHARYGISHDDPSINAPELCRYDAGAEVASDFMATGGAFTATIAGGQYAVLGFKGTPTQPGET